MRISLIAIFSILLSVAAQFALKAGMSSPDIKVATSRPFDLNTVLVFASNRNLLIGFSLYGLGAVIWLSVLAKWDVSKAYPMVGLGFVLTIAIGYLLGEQVRWERFFGCILICAGIFLIAKS